MKTKGIISIDMDGTCLTSDLKVTNETIESLAKAAKQGYLIVPNTGRALSTIPKEILNIPGLRFCITCNGSIIYDKEENKEYYLNEISKQDLIDLMELFRDYPVYLEYFVNNKIFILDEFLEHLDDYIITEFFELFQNSMNHIKKEELDDLLKEGKVTKLNFRLPYSNRKDPELIEKLSKFKSIRINNQADGTGEITSRKASKGNGLKFLADKLDIPKDNIMAIGDDSNDKDMLEEAGTAIVMDQANAEIKELADYITDTNNNNGVAQAIDYILNSI